MKSKRPPGKLLAYLMAMIFLHGWMLWHSWRGIPEGLPDFTIFYTAATILRDGRAAQLYDNHLQEQLQQTFTPVGVAKRGSILPYNHPPFEAVLFVPLARFNYFTAYLIWFALDAGLLLGLTLLLRNCFPQLRSAPKYVWILAPLAFNPLFVALLQGQDSILLLFCYAMAYISLRRAADLRAGAWLGLGLFKFHLVLPFMFPLLLMKRKRFVAGFLLVALLLGLVSLWVVGWHSLLSYPRYVWGTEQDKKYLWNAAQANQPNLRGVFFALLPGANPHLRGGLLAVASGMVVVAMVFAWRAAVLKGPSVLPLAFAANLVGTVLLSFHAYLHDLSPVFLALVIVAEFLAARPPADAWAKWLLYACLAILGCSPVYLVLTLRFRQLQLVAGILLILFLVLLRECARASSSSAITGMDNVIKAAPTA